MDQMQSAEAAVLAVKIDGISNEVGLLRTDVKEISSGLSQLLLVDERLKVQGEAIERAFSSIGDHNTRLQSIERKAPGWEQIRYWVVAGVIGIVALVGTSAYRIVISHV